MRNEARSRSSWRQRLALCALGLWATAGCDRARDETALEPGPRDGQGGAGAGGAGGSTAIAGNAGQGGSVPQVDDAGPDSTADADGASPVDRCQPGPLATYCADFLCPAFDAARQILRDPPDFQRRPAAIVQRPCTAPDGSARVSIGADHVSWTRTFIYDAETHQLTGVVLSNDLGILCDSSADYLSGRHGERAPDCEWRSDLASGCEPRDAGAGDAGSDAGPLECVLTP